MDDREMLEYAAKAAGIDDYTFCELCGGEPALYCRTAQLGIWAPLTDDGDALRLAVKLNITVKVFGANVMCYDMNDKFLADCVDAEDPCAAARLAITRAAAAIGKELKHG